MLVLCVFFALLGAASNATGTVLQRKAALAVPAKDALRPQLLRDLARQPVWLLGICGVVGAALFQALALVTGPLALAQPVFILELPFALLIALPVLQRTLPRSGWTAVGCMVAGLVLALASAAPDGGEPQAPMARWIPAVVLCVAATAFAVGAARHRPSGAARAALLGTGAAVANALTAALMKSAANTFSDDGFGAFLAAWQTYGFAVCGVTAVFLLENALQAGSIAASQPALTLGDATVSLLLGVLVYAEHIRTGWWILPELAGVALITLGTFRLSRVPLTGELGS
ncbi:DMT family transporter [Actinacidiphila bryophytorum]|uniref:DMT family transporter n=1 Tax=Actinacidiphila bryophytorum TaxID=1436133 RepID=UPI002176E9C7|nr:DMT family transporter [Actinacidiphila bryophytorum]UWE13772.1 DMT family transporter [Actinacidiphila bryophytorum]